LEVGEEERKEEDGEESGRGRGKGGKRECIRNKN
jgi:hypothetical protein